MKDENTRQGAERSNRNELAERIRGIQRIVGDMGEGDELPYTAIAERLGGQTTVRQVSYALEKCRTTLEGGGREISVGKASVKVIGIEETQFDRRMRIAESEKGAIGVALWNVLFGLPLPDGYAVKMNYEHAAPKGDPSWAAEAKATRTSFERQIEVLRNRTNIGMVIDAGSTTAIAMTDFLKRVPTIPFRVETKHQGKPVKRILTPIILTNSIVIADQIGSSKFRWGITLRVIGGTDRVDRRSLCGDLSLLWLRACHQEGMIVTVDLSIIGTTGMEERLFDVPSFCCDDSAEAALKSRLLSMGKFRCVIMDSSKLLEGSTSFTFVSAERPSLDLVVIDSGETVGVKNRVSEFGRLMLSKGVAVAVARKT